MCENMICNKCNKYPACNYIPEEEKYICKLCQIELRINYQKFDNCLYYPPKNLKKINVFDDGNQKYENEPNEWLQIGNWKDHPEKIVLVNNNTNIFINSISSWKVSDL